LVHLDLIAQIIVLLGTICHVVAGLRTEICEFIISTANLLVKLAMATSLGPEREVEGYGADQEFILKSLPTSLYTALSKFDIDSKTTLHAACPSCNYTHDPCYDPVSAAASYPDRCLNDLPGVDGRSICGTPLLEVRNGQSRPLKPFLTTCFREYLVKLLANKEIERIVDSACDNALSSLNEGSEGLVDNPFTAEFLNTFEGPVPGQLFIDRGDKVRLAFVVHVDFFNPNGVSTHSNSDSIGLISLALLNLPTDIRYLPQNLYLAVIPGPREPKDHEISYYIRPIVDEFVIGWERGFHISQTASSPDNGRDVEIAMALSLNDLPAARKVSGAAGHTSHFISLSVSYSAVIIFTILIVTSGLCKMWLFFDGKWKNGGLLRLNSSVKRYITSIMSDGLSFGDFRIGTHPACSSWMSCIVFLKDWFTTIVAAS
jgi:hypothetical protein